MMRREFLPFGKPNFSRGELDAVARVLASGWIGMGPETQAFEKELAEYLGTPSVVSVNSCTSALFLALLTRGVGSGDEVICPSLTWCSTANVALYLGAKPIFCDIDPATLCATPATIRAKVTSRTRAVIVVHFGGLAADIQGIQEILPPNVALIEDAAHALGASFPDGTRVGSSRNLTCFSFYANKNLSTGEGGAITVFDESTARRLRSLRLHGLSADAWRRFSHPTGEFESDLAELGYKMNYTDLLAAIGRVQLRRQAEFYEIRLAVARRYCERLDGLNLGIKFQEGLTEPRHTRHLFVALLPVEKSKFSRDEVLAALLKRNVGASVHYHPLHKMSLYLAETQPTLPVTEDVSRRNLTLPISGSMTTQDADYVIDNLVQLIGA